MSLDLGLYSEEKSKVKTLQVVDFAEFREVMLSAEPNALTRRQRSLKGQKSQSSRSSLSSASSGGCMARKHQLDFPDASLQARHAALPQVRFFTLAESSEQKHYLYHSQQSIASKYDSLFLL